MHSGSASSLSLTAAGYDVAGIERDINNCFLSTADQLDMPVIFREVSLRQTLEADRVDQARVVAALTRDDMVNIETMIVIREMLGQQVEAAAIWQGQLPVRAAGAGGRFR